MTAASSSDTRKTARRSVPILADSFTVTEWRLHRNHRLMILDEHDGVNHEDERKLILHIVNKCKVHEQCVVTINM